MKNQVQAEQPPPPLFTINMVCQGSMATDSFVSDISPDGELETAGEGCKYPHRSQGRVVLTWTHGGNFTPLLDNTAGPNIAPYNISLYCRKSTKS